MDGYPPLYPKSRGDYYCGNLRFSNLALEIICCSALFTSLQPHEVAIVLRGAADQIHDLSSVQESEVRACFFQMLDESHPVYLCWSHTDPGQTRHYIPPLLRAFDDVQIQIPWECDWDSERHIATPMWDRSEDY
ncbi:hypothetical protein MMC29_004207 [Sticta canariensis]|nr:hypothetical protein [Sticta canariensis]